MNLTQVIEALLFGAPNPLSTREIVSAIKGAGDSDDLVTNVIDCLAENRIRVSAFRTVVPTLEDVFLKLTGHSIRA